MRVSSRTDQEGAVSAAEGRGSRRSGRPPEPLTAAEVARRLGVPPGWVYRHAHQLGGRRRGRRIRFSARLVDEAAARLRPHGPVRPAHVIWTALSPKAKATLAEIAVPVSLGLSFGEVARQRGLSEKEVAERMRRLRVEMYRQVTRDRGFGDKTGTKS